ncbi:MAG: DNA polymerase subunit beta [Chthoniobacterales bacterium]|nr:MAG: DNA polymerase subunit beta [Chthoniobacterales bacterium]
MSKIGSIEPTPRTGFVPGLESEWARFDVRRAWLFGSRAASSEASESDWDFLIEFSHPPSFDTFMSLKFSLEKRLNGLVDILSRSACTPRFLKAIESGLIDVT